MPRILPASLLLADFAGCLRFFSRLPVPPLSREDDPASAPEFSRAAALVPLAGVVIALPAAAVGAMADWMGLPPLIVGALVVAVGAMSTGALHEDGLADSADGLFGGATRERRLEIMRDSRIGSFGAMALIVTVLLRATAIGAMTADGPAVLVGGVLAAATVSRAAMVGVWHILPSARPDGLAARAGRPSRTALAAAGVSGLVAAGLLASIAGYAPLAGAAVAGLAAAAVARWARARIGGQTGDTLGATQQVAETGFLVALSV